MKISLAASFCPRCLYMVSAADHLGSERMALSLLRASPSSALYCCLAEKKRLRNTDASQLLVLSGSSVMKEGVEDFATDVLALYIGLY